MLLLKMCNGLRNVLTLVYFFCLSSSRPHHQIPRSIKGATKIEIRDASMALVCAASVSEIFGPKPARADVLTQNLKSADVCYPQFFKGYWETTRKITLVEGDSSMAEAAWRGLGGTAEFKALTEQFRTRFVETPTGVILDRGYEMANRLTSKNPGVGSKVVWDASHPDVLEFSQSWSKLVSSDARHVRIQVWQRRVEQLPVGLGLQELVIITNNQGPTKFESAARIQRRFRLAVDDQSNLDGIEIVKTFRLLDGVISDLPTSTTKTRLRLERLPTS
jgi:hypothetical protein